MAGWGMGESLGVQSLPSRASEPETIGQFASQSFPELRLFFLGKLQERVVVFLELRVVLVEGGVITPAVGRLPIPTAAAAASSSSSSAFTLQLTTALVSMRARRGARRTLKFLFPILLRLGAGSKCVAERET